MQSENVSELIWRAWEFSVSLHERTPTHEVEVYRMLYMLN